MSDTRTVTMSKECYEARLNAAHAVGWAAAYEGMAAQFRQQAGELYAHGRDQLARFLRDEVAPKMDAAALHWRAKQKEQNAAADALEAGS